MVSCGSIEVSCDFSGPDSTDVQPPGSIPRNAYHVWARPRETLRIPRAYIPFITVVQYKILKAELIMIYWKTVLNGIHIENHYQTYARAVCVMSDEDELRHGIMHAAGSSQAAAHLVGWGRTIVLPLSNRKRPCLNTRAARILTEVTYIKMKYKYRITDYMYPHPYIYTGAFNLTQFCFKNM